KDKDGKYVSTNADVFPGSKNVRSLDVFTSPAHLKSWSGELEDLKEPIDELKENIMDVWGRL
ncbi:MAG: hypothetical protein II563_09990, partial [Treponema sp.]|nr:hypothetical protein [Treponema sp.]